MSSLSGSLPVIFLGFFESPSQLGYFNLADRIRGLMVTVTQPVTSALFPRMCHLYTLNSPDLRAMLIRIFAIVFTPSLFLSAAITIFAPFFIRIAGGSAFLPSVDLMRILAFAPLFTIVSAFCTHQILIPRRKYSSFNLLSFYALIASLVFLFALVPRYSTVGASFSVLLVEIFACLLAFRFSFYPLENS